MALIPIKKAADQHGVTVAVLKGWYNGCDEDKKPFVIKRLGRRLMVEEEEVQAAFDRLPRYIKISKEDLK